MGMGEGAAKEQKHIGFDHAVDVLEREIGKLGDLVDMVRGTGGPGGEAPKEPLKPSISLADFLGSGQERISALTNRLREHREELRNFLF